MKTCRIVIMGSPFSPIFELGDRLSSYHNLDFVTLEENDTVESNYFSDNIDATYLDMGDFTSGSASQQGERDLSDWSKMKELGEFYVDEPGDPLMHEEKMSLAMEDFVVVSSEIPDMYLVNWSDVTILLTAKEDSVVEWINKRRKCSCCGAVYHLEERVPKNKGYCDRCGSHTFQEERDLPKNVRAQYRLWGRKLWSIEKRMKERGNYIKVNLNEFGTFEDMVHGVERALRKVLKEKDGVDWNYSIS